ncbi:Homocysteine S-methyltransferase 1 [Chamberlinius hualienensis]
MGLTFCEINNTDRFWDKDGLNRCYFETFTSGLSFICIVVALTTALYTYTRNNFRLNQWPKSLLFRFQLLWTILLTTVVIVRFSLQVYTNVWYGYNLLAFSFGFISWPLSAWIIIIECQLAVNSSPTKRHSILLLIFWTSAFFTENLALINLDSSLWWFGRQNLINRIEFGIFIVRYIGSLIIFVIGLYAPGIRNALDSTLPFSISQRLLDEGSVSEGINNDPHSSVQVHQTSTYKDWWKRFKVLMPYLWPKKAAILQLYVLICTIFLIGGRIVNFYVPYLNKEIVNSLSVVGVGADDIPFKWGLILIYGMLMLLQGGGGVGGMGLLNNARNFLWIRVQQYTTRELELLLFGHLHSLSLSWHLKRKTGEVLRAVDRGTNSVNNLLNYILFNIVPTIADVSIAVAYFIYAFNIWFGLIVFVTMALYLGVTIWLTEWRTKYRRSMNQLDNAVNSTAVDSLLNFETVKYYGAEDFEVQRYKEAILNFQEAEWKSNTSAVVVNICQVAIITSGLIGCSLLCAYMISRHKGLTVGDYVLLGSYILQLYMPLNWFGTYYRMIQQNFIDMENMFDLLKTEKDVKDFEGAPDIKISGGEIVFSNVYFSYTPERQILKNVSFIVQPGKTVALVGPTGSGKTTVVRLLFRFYDIQQGNILIDGQDISQVTQNSIRKSIGVVPQDTVLFNSTIKYNIRYGRITATDEEVEDASKAAEMNEQILKFPQGYETVVGERGLKLSGGEKQRVAIARTILKAPAIVMLDEATSALDTKTERQIQASLSQICANRSSLVVAHRLSTIIDADEILVLKEGEIVERGTHEQLLNLGGLYDSMWRLQLEKTDNNGSHENHL